MASSRQQAKFDLGSICEALGSIEHKWFKIGIQLRIPRSKLQEFKKDEYPLSAVIDYCLRGNVTETCSPISWDSIVVMLKSKSIDEPGLAEEISKMYCQQEDCSQPITPPADKHHLQENKQVEQAAANSSDAPSQPPAPCSEGKVDPDVKLDLKFILQKNLKEIIAKYASYVDCLRVAIREQGVSADDLRSYLLSLSATRETCKCQKLALLAGKETQLKECNTVTDIFNFLTTKCASFLNYDIFQFILTRYGISDDQDTLKYPDHLKAYIRKHKISEFTKINPLLRTKNGSKDLIVKYDVETTCSLDKIEELKILIAEIMEINPSALEIIDIEEGCVIVTFSISAPLADALFTPNTIFTPQQKEDLRTASVLWLDCNGCTIHFKAQMDMEEDLRKLKDQLTCSICLDTYTDPRRLRCRHTYCQQCLMKLVEPASIPHHFKGDFTITCPTCHRVTYVKDKGALSLPLDIDVLEPSRTVTEWKETIISGVCVSIFCSSHEKLMNRFCYNCIEPICSECRHTNHYSHRYNYIDKAYKSFRKKASSALQNIETAIPKFNIRSEEISQQRTVIETRILSITTEDVGKTELISDLHQLFQIKITRLASRRDQLEDIQVQLNKHLSGMTDTRNRCEALVQMKSTSVKQVREIMSSLDQHMLDPTTETLLQFSLVPLGDKIVWQVHDGKYPNLTKCTIENYSIRASVGEWSFFILQACNYLPLNFIKCELIADETFSVTPGKIEQIETEKYKVSYKPVMKGRYRLHLKIADQNILESPYPIRVNSSTVTIGEVRGPMGVAVKREGEVLVTLYEEDCFAVFSPSGERLQTIGTRGSGQGEFQRPYGIALDSEENIYVADRYNHRIQKFTPQGAFLTSVGTKGKDPLQFDNPYGVAFNVTNGKVYVVDENCHVQILNPDLSYYNMFGKKGSGEGEFRGPRHMACDGKGNVYVTDFYNHRIQVFTAEGKFMRVFWEHENKSMALKEPYGIAIDSSNKVYVSDFKSGISMYTSYGQFLTSLCGEGDRGLAVGNSGILCACDAHNNCVIVI